MYRLIGAASCWGSELRTCEDGPETLQAFGLREKLAEQRFPMAPWSMLYPKIRAKEQHVPLPECISLIHDINDRLADEVEQTLLAGEVPVVIDGDHSLGVGTWNGVYQFLKKRKELPLGLIWVDAHMDSHTPETSPSGAWAGMSAAALLGYGHPSMARLKQTEPILAPENLCFVGVRSFEEGEKSLLHKLNVRIFYIEEIRERGMQAVMRDAVEHVKRRTKFFGISIDFDSIDPREASAVGRPENNGLDAGFLCRALEQLRCEKQAIAFELAGYNPLRDIGHRTARIGLDLLKHMLVPE